MRIQILKMYIPSFETEQFTYFHLQFNYSLNKYIKDTKNVDSTLVRCCIQWTNIDSTSCVCWDMTEIQIMEQYNCITCIKIIILVMFVVSILNKGKTVNNKKIRNEEKKKM